MHRDHTEYKLVIEKDPKGLWGGYVEDRPVFAWGKRTPQEVALSLLEGIRLLEEVLQEEEG